MAAYVENERLHNIEMEAILELSQALKPDEAQFDELVAKGKDLTFTRTAVEETCYNSCVARMAVVETRVAAENASWKARVAEFEAGKASSAPWGPRSGPLMKMVWSCFYRQQPRRIGIRTGRCRVGRVGFSALSSGECSWGQTGSSTRTGCGAT